MLKIYQGNHAGQEQMEPCRNLHTKAPMAAFGLGLETPLVFAFSTVPVCTCEAILQDSTDLIEGGKHNHCADVILNRGAPNC